MSNEINEIESMPSKWHKETRNLVSIDRPKPESSRG
jgi:hypothetical protein